MIDYEPIGWIDRETARTTPTSAANFNHMDEGIEQATNFANETREKVDALESRQSIQEARMDTIASLPSGSVSTKGDAELNDIRSGYDGSVYTTAGNAVRGQAKTLQGYIDALEAANAVLSGQIENLVQTSSEATVGNEELIDIRTGYDGTVYNTAGTAVREQISAVITKVENTDNTKTVTQEEYDALSEEEKTNGTIYFITDGGGVRQAATVEYDNERSGLTGTTVQAAIDETVAGMQETDTSLQEQIASLNSSIVTYDHTFMLNGGFVAGSIGTRAGQKTIANPYPDYTLIGIIITHIADSSAYNPKVFLSNNNIYCNWYRATASALTEIYTTTNVRLIYKK